VPWVYSESGFGKLPDGLGLAAQTTSSHGKARRDRLAGTVEVDETYLGGLEEGVRGRQTEKKALIVVAAEEDGKGIGRI
jgi:hypothetical protein